MKKSFKVKLIEENRELKKKIKELKVKLKKEQIKTSHFRIKYLAIEKIIKKNKLVIK